MRTSRSLCIAFIGLITIALRAEPKPVATGAPAGAQTPVVAISIRENDKPSRGAFIDLEKSASADPSGKNVNITAIKDGERTALGHAKAVTFSDFNHDQHVGQINLVLPAGSGTDATYEVELLPDGQRPALTYQANGQSHTEQGPIKLDATFGPKDRAYLERTQVLKPSIELGGGSDGSLLSIHARTGNSKTEDHNYARWFVDIDAALSPGDAHADSLIYGHAKGEAAGLWRWMFPDDSHFDGAAFFGMTAGFKSDQTFDNWDATVGVASWWFVNSSEIDWLGGLLHRVLQPDDKVPTHPLAFKLGADYVYDSKRDPGKQDPSNIQVSAHLIWLNRVYSGFKLPLMEPTYNVNSNLDVAATWEPEKSDFHPETKLSLEFSPTKVADDKLAFTLTWAKGQFSPTFADEDAFLAGIKWKF